MYDKYSQEDKIKAAAKFLIFMQGYTTENLLDGTECQNTVGHRSK